MQKKFNLLLFHARHFRVHVYDPSYKYRRHYTCLLISSVEVAVSEQQWTDRQVRLVP